MNILELAKNLAAYLQLKNVRIKEWSLATESLAC